MQGPSLSWHWTIKALHWVMAALIIGMICLGWLMVTWKPSIPLSFSLFQLHKSFGFLIFSLLMLRLIVRLIYGAVPYPAHMAFFERALATFIQFLLYGVMLAMPVTGWLMGSASGFPTKPFGLFTLPDFIARDVVLAAQLRTTHEILSFILVGALLLHTVGALKHHFWDRDDVLFRMLPGRRRFQSQERRTEEETSSQ